MPKFVIYKSCVSECLTPEYVEAKTIEDAHRHVVAGKGFVSLYIQLLFHDQPKIIPTPEMKEINSDLQIYNDSQKLKDTIDKNGIKYIDIHPEILYHMFLDYNMDLENPDLDEKPDGKPDGKTNEDSNPDRLSPEQAKICDNFNKLINELLDDQSIINIYRYFYTGGQGVQVGLPPEKWLTVTIKPYEEPEFIDLFKSIYLWRRPYCEVILSLAKEVTEKRSKKPKKKLNLVRK